MKNIILALSILFVTSTAFSQADVNLTICNIPSVKKAGNKSTSNIISISVDKLLDCGEIHTSDNNYKITSFSIGMAAGKDYVEVSTDGYKLNEKMIAQIKKNQPKKIYIEKIKLINNSGSTSDFGPLTLILK